MQAAHSPVRMGKPRQCRAVASKKRFTALGIPSGLAGSVCSKIDVKITFLRIYVLDFIWDQTDTQSFHQQKCTLLGDVILHSWDFLFKKMHSLEKQRVFVQGKGTASLPPASPSLLSYGAAVTPSCEMPVFLECVSMIKSVPAESSLWYFACSAFSILTFPARLFQNFSGFGRCSLNFSRFVT